MINFKKSLLIVTLLSITTIFSQKEIGNEPLEIKVIAYATKNTIMLRWAVTTPIAWKFSNEKGYVIERKTIVRDGKLVQNPKVIQLNKIPIKPKPMMQWEEFTKKNNYAAIAAQAIYGEDFNVQMSQDNGLISILNQVEALEQRFSFALFAADQNFEVAKFSGLAHVDNNVKNNERYLYTIKVVDSPEHKKIKSGGVYLGLNDQRPLPRPQEFVGIFKDKTTLLSWNFALLKRYYNSYVIERSNDGTNFKALTDTPLVNLSERETKPSDRMMYIDSLALNNKTYQYRIKGISPFGISGPYSDPVSGKGIKSLTHRAYFTEVEFSNEKNAVIKWEFPKEGINELSYFKIVSSDKPKGTYTVVVPEISKEQRSYNLTNLQSVTYCKIISVGNDGSERKSFPKMVQPDDNTPPAVPSELVGKIDSLGVVKLQWKLNTEKDFLGYRVFKSNLNDDEFTQITFKPTPHNFITDTINLKVLNKKIYYKVQSFDKRYNPSDFSKKLALKRPDIIPPTQPVFSSFKLEAGKVFLKWVTSSSTDVKSTLVYRKEKGSKQDWKLVEELRFPIDRYIDKEVLPTKTYLYTLLSLDNSGLESEPITPLKITISDDLKKPKIKNFSGVVDRENMYIKLKWVYKQPNIAEYILYKAKEGKELTMYKTFKNSDNKFIDKRLIINTKYTYLLQAVFVSGAKSPMNKIELNY